MKSLKNKWHQFCLPVLCILCSNMVSAEVFKQHIHENWMFKQARLNNWYKADVPGVVHTDLMANGIIEDPFYRLNERAVQWIDKEDWIYETEFTGHDKIVTRENQQIVFKGLDTYADVYLNDSLILKANNMFLEWKTNVKGILKAGKNKLKVYFHSPVKIDMPKWEALPYQLKADNDQSENGGLLNRKIGIFARKAGYHYGWDWGPRLVTSGIWRPVYLEAWDNIKIENVHIIQKEVSSERANLTSAVEIISSRNIKNAIITIKADERLIATKCADLKKGLNEFRLDYTIKEPQLW